MPWIGFLLGAAIGFLISGFRGGAAGGAVGLVIGLLLHKLRWDQAWQRAQPRSAEALANTKRIVALEERLGALESALARSGIELPPAPPMPAPPPTTGEPMAEQAVIAPESTESTLAAAALPGVPPPPRFPVRKGGAGEPGPAPIVSDERAAPAAAADTPSAGAARLSGMTPSWSWFTGNTMVRVGVVVLFFGVAFLLSYFAEHATIPIELQFTGVALAGAAMISAGAWLSRSRRAYGLALVGGGLGVVYLTAFAAFQRVPLLSAPVAFALLAVIATAAIVLSLAFNAEALAALAAFGGLLAPVLVDTVSEPVPLFGYVAAVNAVVVGVALFRAWRVLDFIGFLGTFVLGLWWGYQYYDAANFAVIEPFLGGFFLVYVAVPILHAFRGSTTPKLDAALVFGVPIVAFGLQGLLVHDTPYGLAWTAAILAAAYAVLWLALRRRRALAAPTLASAFGALAVVFASLTFPFAVDARWTSAAWTVEAAGLFWIGCRWDRPLVRAFALVLQFGAGVAFLFGQGVAFFLGGPDASSTPAFANRQFLGIAAIALSALASVRFGDARGKSLPATERTLLHLLFGWGCVWWLGGGLAEVSGRIAAAQESHALLGWTVGSIGAATLLASALRWPRLDATAVVLVPALALALAHDVASARTSVTEYGWAVYPLAWALHFALLYRGEMRAAAASAVTATRTDRALRAWLAAAHALGALLLLAQIAWEAGEWTARLTPRDTVWSACAHLAPLAVYLLAVTPAKTTSPWPLRSFADAYSVSVGTIVAAALAVGFIALALLNPGDPRPLLYLPLANPLELTLAGALAALFFWAKGDVRVPLRTLYRLVGAGAFIVLNGIVVRSVHHWLGVPWRLEALVASRPLQAALTLTWTIAALAAMVMATRRALRGLWLAGAALLGAVVVKLFAVDLAALSGLSRVVAFLGVGALLLVIGYASPLPPAVKDATDA
jgi:uncharacterized membrane protein